MFRVISARTAAYEAYRLLIFFNVICLGLLVVYGSDAGYKISAFVFFCTAIFMNLSKKYRETPFSLITSFVVSVYFVMPITFAGILGAGYEYGAGFLSENSDNSLYIEIAPSAVLFLTVCLVSLWLGVVLGNKKRMSSNFHLLYQRRSKSIWVIGLLVGFFTYTSNQDFIKLVGKQEEIHESLLTFIFFDHAFFVFAAVSFFTLLTYAQRNKVLGYKLQFAVIMLVFLVISTMASSKGFILVIISLFFILPISYLMRDDRNLVFFPSKMLLVLMLPLAICLFVYSYYARTLLHSGGEGVTYTNIMNIIHIIGDDGFIVAINTIFYRIAAAYDRYVLIYYSYIGEKYSVSYAWEYSAYLYRNFLNLILPGTPFQESYAPSSNLLGQVLSKEALNNNFTEIELAKSLNTQPYTLPGVLIIISGFVTPLIIFFLSACLTRIYSIVSRPWFHLSLLYLFSMLLLSYGVEVSIANAVHFSVSLIIFMMLAKQGKKINMKNGSSSARHKKIDNISTS